MGNAFSNIAFTTNVKALQERSGSRAAYAGRAQGPLENAELSVHEIAFIEARDSFYLGTVTETGWPYVQHRGGPGGFLKVLDSRTLGFADFSGNRQYVSTGNIVGNPRVCLFLMDYPHQARLKILGRARLVENDTDPDLLTRLDNPHYRARVERGVVIEIEGFDWNCPKYITPRFTEAEVAAYIREAERLAPSASTTNAAEESLGSGELELTITGVRQLTPDIRAYELRGEAWSELPTASAGAHLEVPVRLEDGSIARRHYSLLSNPRERDFYEIAVRHEADGRGGSRAIHGHWHIGTRLRVPFPINHFPLHSDARPAVLIAGGIGITPIKAMASELRLRGQRFELHYSARTPRDMAYRAELARDIKIGFRMYFSQAQHGGRMDVPKIVRNAAPDSVIYVCGPGSLIESVREAARDIGLPASRVQYESFY
ncbi:MAG: pyridoxamine 5'-phosphate oxidase family protein [Gammaproteobacteria bacterium]|nr:pyridoxamine 5'-phosphate oxidase family protein [Gammaproteobacteria bacterium]